MMIYMNDINPEVQANVYINYEEMRILLEIITEKVEKLSGSQTAENNTLIKMQMELKEILEDLEDEDFKDIF